MLALDTSGTAETTFPSLSAEAEGEGLVEKDIRDRFKKMCEGYFENVAKKLVLEHKVSRFRFSSRGLLTAVQRLQEQDRRNHEAYIRSGEIFEDRQQAYEKMTKSYEKLLASSQTYVLRMYIYITFALKELTTRLSELLYLPMPSLPSSSSTGNSIQIGTNTGALLSDDAEEAAFAALGGKWEDEEERRFFEDIQDLREIVPKSILGIEASKDVLKDVDESDAEAKKNAEDEEVKRLQEELAGLEAPDGAFRVNGKADLQEVAEEEEDDGYGILLLASFPSMTQLDIVWQRRYPYTFYSKGGFASDYTDSCPTGSLATTHRSACAFAGLYEPHPHRPSRC